MLDMIYIAPLMLHIIYISPLSSCTSIFKIQVHSYAQVLMDMRHMIDGMQCKTWWNARHKIDDITHITHAFVVQHSTTTNLCVLRLCVALLGVPQVYGQRTDSWIELDWWVKTDGATDYSSKATKLILQGGPLKLKANPLDGGEKVVRVAWCVVRVRWYVMCFGLSSLLPLVAGGDW